ncbi:MAG TPA: archease, partial [Chloroflexota bacterium]
ERGDLTVEVAVSAPVSHDPLHRAAPIPSSPLHTSVGVPLERRGLTEHDDRVVPRSLARFLVEPSAGAAKGGSSMQASRPFETFEHTADVGLLAHGRTLADVFAHAAQGMFALLVDLDAVRETESRQVEVADDDLASLLVAWLNELLFLFDVEHLLFRRFAVSLAERGGDALADQRGAGSPEGEGASRWRLTARAYGERVDPRRHLLGTHIKAATYHQAEVWQEQGAWHARVILDV